MSAVISTPRSPKVCALTRVGSVNETFFLLSGSSSVAGTSDLGPACTAPVSTVQPDGAGRVEQKRDRGSPTALTAAWSVFTARCGMRGEKSHSGGRSCLLQRRSGLSANPGRPVTSAATAEMGVSDNSHSVSRQLGLAERGATGLTASPTRAALARKTTAEGSSSTTI